MNKTRNVGGDTHIDPNKGNKNVGAGLVSARKGITLVALVITIIILLILAAITINLTIGQKGILTRAEEAGRNYQEAVRKEDEDLGKFLGEADNIIAEINTPKSTSGDNYTMVDGIPVPKGFKHTEGTKETGFVIQDNSGTETNGNEFVWIPCGETEQKDENGVITTIKYDRYAFSKEGWNLSQTKSGEEIKMTIYGTEFSFTEPKSNVELEINSIKKYGGFYIGRYEVGIVNYDETIKTINTNNDKEWTGYTNGTAVVQANKQVWNYITKDMAKKVAEGMYAKNNAVISRLCNSYAWDTTLQFIGGDYAINSEGDNYSGDLNNTGKNSTARKGIYDMGGNVAEWTTEVCSAADTACTFRGGIYSNDASYPPAGGRGYEYEILVNENVGFRSTLYVGL